MSAAHDDTHAHAAPEQPEVSHPLLWSVCIFGIMIFLTWLFFHYLYQGMHAARHHAPLAVHSTGEAEPNHEALAKNKSPEVIDAGAVIYNAKCANCHGSQGNSNPTNLKPVPRNFHTDAWKNPDGGSPYALYLVLTKGLGTMPAFQSLTPEQRYAVNHYIVETWVKTNNKVSYVAENSDELKKQIPPPGAAGAHGAEHHPEDIESKAPVLPLMAGIAKTEDVLVVGVRAWAELARLSVKSDNASLVESLVTLVNTEPGLGQMVQSAVKANDRARFSTLLTSSDGSGAVHADFNLASADQIGGLFEFLKGVK
jgi:mono/diheme cytochrome c family protein